MPKSATHSHKDISLAEVANLVPVASYLDVGGSPVQHQLSALRISPELVERGDGKITKVQLYGFLNRCRSQVGLPDLGYRAGVGFGPEQLGGLGHRMIRAITLQEALNALSEHVANWVADNRIWVERRGNEAWLRNTTWGHRELDREVANQCSTMVLINVIRMVAGKDWCPQRVVLEMQPNRIHEGIEALANAEVRFSPSETAILFPVEFLSRPIRTRTSRGGNSALPRKTPNDFAGALSEVVRPLLSSIGAPNLEVAAEITGLSTRTIQRRLARESLTYSRLMDRIRFPLASEMLTTSSATLGEIAATLGYSGANNFLRAFRRLAGVTPGKFRRLYLEGSKPTVRL